MEDDDDQDRQKIAAKKWLDKTFFIPKNLLYRYFSEAAFKTLPDIPFIASLNLKILVMDLSFEFPIHRMKKARPFLFNC